MILADLFRAAALGGTAFLVFDASSLALWGIVITSAAGLITGEMVRRAEVKRREQQREWDLEDRATLKRDLAQNTSLTLANGQAAERAYNAANNVNAKIATIAAAALVIDRATEKTSTAAIRKDIAAIREDAQERDH